MIFLLGIVVVLGLYWSFMAISGMIVLWRSSWVTRNERAAVKRWRQQRGT